MSDHELVQRLEQSASLLDAIRQRLQDEVGRLGFATEEVVIGGVTEAIYRLANDPASGEASLIGEWRDDAGMKLGEVLLHADGSFFAEHDVIKTHPRKPRFFVEAVTAWGRDAMIKSEPRLLPMVS